MGDEGAARAAADAAGSAVRGGAANGRAPLGADASVAAPEAARGNGANTRNPRAPGGGGERTLYYNM